MVNHHYQASVAASNRSRGQQRYNNAQVQVQSQCSNPPHPCFASGSPTGVDDVSILPRAPPGLEMKTQGLSACYGTTNVPPAESGTRPAVPLGRITTGPGMYHNAYNHQVDLEWLTIPALPGFDNGEGRSEANYAVADQEVSRLNNHNHNNVANYQYSSSAMTLLGGRSNPQDQDGEQQEPYEEYPHRQEQDQRQHSASACDSPSLAPKRARKGRAKTEICRYYLKGKTCPFSEMCSYAHGHDELRAACLKDLVQDETEAVNFRCRPCQTFVATGACPYGSRCHFLHDPRVAGPDEAWMCSKDMPTKIAFCGSPTGNAWENNKTSAVSAKDVLAKNNSSSSNNNSAAAAVIDTEYNVRLETLNRGNPMGMLEIKSQCYDFVYDAACNLSHANLQDMMRQKVTNRSDRAAIAERLSFVMNRASTHKCKYLLTERHRLEMVLAMRCSANKKTHETVVAAGDGSNAESSAANNEHPSTAKGVEFWPTHSLFGQEGCMILQKKAFIILPAPLLSSCSDHHEAPLVQEIDPLEIEVWERIMRHCPTLIVHKLAFGPEHKNNVLPTSYWFGLAEGPDLIKTTYPHAKRIVDEIKNRNKAGIHDDEDEDDVDAPVLPFNEHGNGAHAGRNDHGLPRSLPLLFTTATPFFDLCPKDEATFDLITDMMKHRLAMLMPVWKNSVQGFGTGESVDHLMHRLQSHARVMAVQEVKLRLRLNAHRRHWNGWCSWPRTEGHALSLPLTNDAMEGPVPSGVCTYEVPRGPTLNHNKHAKLRWDGFISQLLHEKTESQLRGNKVGGNATKRKTRLPIFQSLKTKDDEKARLGVFKRLTAKRRQVGGGPSQSSVGPVLSSKTFGSIGPFTM